MGFQKGINRDLTLLFPVSPEETIPEGSPCSIGIKKNNGEFGLIFFTFNFRRVMNIFGFKRANKTAEEAVFTALYTMGAQRC